MVFCGKHFTAVWPRWTELRPERGLHDLRRLSQSIDTITIKGPGLDKSLDALLLNLDSNVLHVVASWPALLRPLSMPQPLVSRHCSTDISKLADTGQSW